MMTVTRHTLNNGLTILLKEVHSAPITSWWLLYRTGSRSEPTGKTGISHWVEHMLFKGTPRYPVGVLDREIDRLGGMWNAQTAADYTAYFATLPADKITLALDIEADRMVNARFDPDDVEAERSVVIAERQGLENSPLFWLNEEVTAAAFRVHGYHHDVIGDMADLTTMTRDDLYAHYRAHYHPDNAIAVAVGDFDTADLLAAIEAHYGDLPPRSTPARPLHRPEPPQSGERRVVVERPGTTGFIEVVYRSLPADHPDWHALALLGSVLVGAVGIGGEEVDNKTSRLYHALVHSELAAEVSGGLQPAIDPFLFEISLTLRDGIDHAQAEAALDAALQQVADDGISAAELARARKQAQALFAYSTEGVTEQAFWLAFAENLGDYRWFEDYLPRLEAVTLDQVNAVARAVLRPQNRVVGWFVPTDLDGLALAEDDGEAAYDEVAYDD
ncbi:insulinase family protein [bacterium]|nr:insulinase family protein [bacterium]